MVTNAAFQTRKLSNQVRRDYLVEHVFSNPSFHWDSSKWRNEKEKRKKRKESKSSASAFTTFLLFLSHFLLRMTSATNRSPGATLENRSSFLFYYYFFLFLFLFFFFFSFQLLLPSFLSLSLITWMTPGSPLRGIKLRFN